MLLCVLSFSSSNSQIKMEPNPAETQCRLSIFSGCLSSPTTRRGEKEQRRSLWRLRIVSRRYRWLYQRWCRHFSSIKAHQNRWFRWCLFVFVYSGVCLFVCCLFVFVVLYIFCLLVYLFVTYLFNSLFCVWKVKRKMSFWNCEILHLVHLCVLPHKV